MDSSNKEALNKGRKKRGKADEGDREAKGRGQKEERSSGSDGAARWAGKGREGKREGKHSRSERGGFKAGNGECQRGRREPKRGGAGSGLETPATHSKPSRAAPGSLPGPNSAAGDGCGPSDGDRLRHGWRAKHAAPTTRSRSLSPPPLHPVPGGVHLLFLEMRLPTVTRFPSQISTRSRTVGRCWGKRSVAGGSDCVGNECFFIWGAARDVTHDREKGSVIAPKGR